jgi:hypothetical protein
MWMLPIIAYANNATPEVKAAHATDIMSLAEWMAAKAGVATKADAEVAA